MLCKVLTLRSDYEMKRRSRARKDRIDLSLLQGVITFFGSHHAIRAEELLKRRGITAVLIPGPREISPNCGVAVRFDFERKEEVLTVFGDHLVHYEDIHYYPEK
jgi:hypothetical protein